MSTDHVAEILLSTSRSQGQRRFLTFWRDEAVVDVSYAEFCAQVRAWSQFLRSRGVQSGDRVGIISPKSPLQVRAFYACWWLGAIAVPVSEGLGPGEMAFVLDDADPKLILTDPTLAGSVGERAGGRSVLGFRHLPTEGLTTPGPEIEPVAGDAVAALIYTSGSTGLPKGVMLTHRNLAVNAAAARDAIEMGAGDTILSLLPYWHSFALLVEVVLAVLIGARVAVPRDKRDFRRHMARYQPTVVLVVPRIVDALRIGLEEELAKAPAWRQRLFRCGVRNASRIFTAGPRFEGGLLRRLAHRLFYDPLVFARVRRGFGGRLRFFIGGGAPLDIEPQIFFKYLGIPVYQGYGLTESSPVISANAPHRHKLGSSGRLVPWLSPEHGGDYTFLDESGNRGKDRTGELLVKGDCVMKGYWRHADSSSKALVAGWLHTGDMGYVDADGFLFLRGRRGNLIVLLGGEKLHPEPVEDAIRNCGLVAETMVIGEKCKHVYVCVNLKPDAAQGMDPSQLQQLLRRQVADRTAHLAAYERPKDVLVLPDFTPDDGTLTTTMKVRRHQVWARYGEQINRFLRGCGEDVGTERGVSLASSRVIESLGRGGACRG